MSYAKMVNDFYSALSKEPSGEATTDMTTHANDFASAVDNYVKELQDPGKRKLKSTTKALMVPILLLVTATPATGNASTDATLAALQYATAVQVYTLALVVDTSTAIQNISGVPPSSTIISGVVTAPSMLTSLQSDFKSIFTEEVPEGVTLPVLTLQKATKFADAIKSAFSSTVVTISGLDSSPPPPAGPGPQPFTLVGPLEEP